MQVKDEYKNALHLANNATVISETIFKKLLENCFSVLAGRAEIHNINNLYNSKPDVIKEVYAALLYISTEFTRHNQSKDEVTQYLTANCNYTPFRTKIFTDLYEKNKQNVEISLLNIGNHLPHITDVKWKIDYIVKSNTLDQSDGPLFRISLQTEVFDNDLLSKNHKNVNFTCNSQELQDLVYKLKDAARHCQRLATEH